MGPAVEGEHVLEVPWDLVVAVLDPVADPVPADALVLFDEVPALLRGEHALGQDQLRHVGASDLEGVHEVVVVARRGLGVEEHPERVDAAALDGVVAEVHAVDAEVLEVHPVELLERGRHVALERGPEGLDGAGALVVRQQVDGLVVAEAEHPSVGAVRAAAQDAPRRDDPPCRDGLVREVEHVAQEPEVLGRDEVDVALDRLVDPRVLLHHDQRAVVHLDGAARLAVVGHGLGRPAAEPFERAVLVVGEGVPEFLHALLVGDDDLLGLRHPRAHVHHRQVAGICLLQRIRGPVLLAAHELSGVDPVLSACDGEEVGVEVLADLGQRCEVLDRVDVVADEG